LLSSLSPLGSHLPQEIFRKLLLSTIGVFWSDKSPLAIATALLLCTASLVLHVNVQPFKSHKSNLLQFFCLSVLTGVYFAGLLLKTQAAAPNGGIGVVLVIGLVSAILAAFALAIMEFRTGLRHLRKLLHNFSIRYSGAIHPVKGLNCIASFPGKYSEGWDKVVALGTGLSKKQKQQASKAEAHRDVMPGTMQHGSLDQEQDTLLSVACVFFTQYTPKFGEHSINPETGKCWCHSLYGESKCWGCQWFVEWWENVKEAHYIYKQTLIVYYFPDQVGQGKIKWENAADEALLRDKVLVSGLQV
jgi:hypothetical protein